MHQDSALSRRRLTRIAVGLASFAACCLVAALLMAPYVDKIHSTTQTATARTGALALLACGVFVLIRRGRIRPQAAAWSLTALLVVDIVALQIAQFGRRPIQPEISFPEEMREILAREALGRRVLCVVPEFTNLSLTYGYEDVNGYGVTMPADFARCAAWTTGDIPRAAHRILSKRPTIPFCFWFAVSHLIVYRQALADPDRWTEVFHNDRVALWRLNEDWPRAQLFHQYQSVTREQAEALMRPPGKELMSELIVEDLPADFEFPTAAQYPSRESAASWPVSRELSGATLTRLGVNGASWTVRTAEPAWLLIHETWNPAWRVWLNGRDVPLRRAQYCLVAVAVPPGVHDVEMAYRPRSVLWGVCVSAFTVLALAGLWISPKYV
jgi:hypothetical protein